MFDWNKIHKRNVKYWQISDDLLEKILSSVESKKTAIDLGCGDGRLLQQLIQQEVKAEGVDVSSEAIKKSRINFCNASTKIVDIAEENFGKYDLIFLKFVLEFIDDKDGLLKKIKSSCKNLILITSIKTKIINNAHANRICISEDEIQPLLTKYFKSINLFFEEECELGLSRRIYILK